MVFPTFSDNHWRVRESPRPARATCRVLIPSQLLMVSKAAARQLVGNLRLREGFRGWSPVSATTGIPIAGWWFGTLFFHSVGNFIIPTDELHHFSEG